MYLSTAARVIRLGKNITLIITRTRFARNSIISNCGKQKARVGFTMTFFFLFPETKLLPSYKMLREFRIIIQLSLTIENIQDTDGTKGCDKIANLQIYTRKITRHRVIHAIFILIDDFSAIRRSVVFSGANKYLT